MDILTDILNSAGLEKMLLTRHSFYKAWAIKFPCEKSIGFHIVTQGQVYIRSPYLKKAIHLKRGDIIMIKRGFNHEIATDLNVKTKTNFNLTENKADGENSLATLVCGLYQFQTEPIHPLFAELPDYILIKEDEISSHSPLYVAEQLLSAELDNTELGKDSITKSLLDIIFHYILRDWISKRSHNNYSWTRALKDQHIQKAISSIHGNVKKDWTVDELADVSCLSRAAFALKFKKLTGDSPAHYLTTVRIQKVMDLLRATDDGLEAIAEKVGYGDSFVLSKAFKRVVGVSPKEFRTQLLKET